MSPKELWSLTAKTTNGWFEDRVSRMAAALAFYTVFSVAPILVIAIAVAGKIFGRQAAEHEVSRQLSGLMGRAAADAINTMIENANAPGSHGMLATIISIILLIYGSTNVFTELQDSMNTVWEVKPKPGASWWWPTVKDRLLSFALVMAIAFLLLVSLVISAALAGISTWMSAGSIVAYRIMYGTGSFVVFTAVFSAMFKILPDAKVKWRDVWLGGVITSSLFTLGKVLIGLYLARPSVSSVYGAAGSLAVLLIWVYFSSQILLIGAEFTHVWACRHGHHVKPDEKSVKITEEDRAQQGIPKAEQLQAKVEAQEQREKPLTHS